MALVERPALSISLEDSPAPEDVRFVRQGLQALPFYEKHGYAVLRVLDDLPRGHSRYFMKKALG